MAGSPVTGTRKRAIDVLLVSTAAGFVAAVVLFVVQGISMLNLALIGGFYSFAFIGITVGFHRLFAHRSFTAPRWLRVTLAVAGEMTFEGSVAGWVAYHRRHHLATDKPGDPHSPSTPFPGWGGLWRAHIGWLYTEMPEPDRYARDVLDDSALKRVDQLTPLVCVGSLVLPAVLGWAIGGTFWAGITAFVWAGLFRVFLTLHVTWAINSLCHAIGRRQFATRDRSRNVWWLALMSFGESWHNDHHAFPNSARIGARWWQVDFGWYTVWLLERVGLAKAVRRPTRLQVKARRNADAVAVPA